SAAADTISADATYVAGSSAVTPNRSEETQRESPMAEATPTIPPTHAGKIPRQVDGRLGNIGRRHSESSAGEVYRLGAGSGTEVERAPASQSEFVQRIFEVFVQFRIEPGHGFDLLSLIQLLPMWELALLIFGHIHPSPIALVSVGGLVDIGVRLR